MRVAKLTQLFSVCIDLPIKAKQFKSRPNARTKTKFKRRIVKGGLTFNQATDYCHAYNDQVTKKAYYIIETIQYSDCFKTKQIEAIYADKIEAMTATGYNKPDKEIVDKLESRRIKDYKPEYKFCQQGNNVTNDYEPINEAHKVIVKGKEIVLKNDKEQITPIKKAISAIWTPSPKSIIHKNLGTKKKPKLASFADLEHKSEFKMYSAYFHRLGYDWKYSRKLAKRKVYGK